jgi:transposase
MAAQIDRDLESRLQRVSSCWTLIRVLDMHGSRSVRDAGPDRRGRMRRLLTSLAWATVLLATGLLAWFAFQLYMAALV